MSLEKPSWISSDIDLYRKLFYGDIGRQLTDKEKDFVKDMYIMEQYAKGLDGD